MTAFRGFGPGVREWFRGLESDNNKGYFSAHRHFYEESIRDQMKALLTELSQDFGGEIKMFRQNRDIRFSRDKSPYKTNTYGILHGTAIAGEGLYASISADGLLAGSGYHVMAPDQLERYRLAVIDRESGAQLIQLLDRAQRSGLEVWGESLTTAPRGYPRDHERIEVLRRKNLVLGRVLKVGRGITRTEGLQFVAATWRMAGPVTEWLDARVGPSIKPHRRRGSR
jgi:uncharacterized protein (TIGR02453 family)